MTNIRPISADVAQLCRMRHELGKHRAKFDRIRPNEFARKRANFGQQRANLGRIRSESRAWALEEGHAAKLEIMADRASHEPAAKSSTASGLRTQSRVRTSHGHTGFPNACFCSTNFPLPTEASEALPLWGREGRPGRRLGQRVAQTQRGQRVDLVRSLRNAGR